MFLVVSPISVYARAGTSTISHFVPPGPRTVYSARMKEELLGFLGKNSFWVSAGLARGGYRNRVLTRRHWFEKDPPQVSVILGFKMANGGVVPHAAWSERLQDLPFRCSLWLAGAWCDPLPFLPHLTKGQARPLPL